MAVNAEEKKPRRGEFGGDIGGAAAGHTAAPGAVPWAGPSPLDDGRRPRGTTKIAAFRGKFGDDGETSVVGRSIAPGATAVSGASFPARRGGGGGGRKLEAFRSKFGDGGGDQTAGNDGENSVVGGPVATGATSVSAAPFPVGRGGGGGRKLEAFRSKFGEGSNQTAGKAGSAAGGISGLTADGKSRVEEVGVTVPPGTSPFDDRHKTKETSKPESAARTDFPIVFSPDDGEEEPPALTLSPVGAHAIVGPQDYVREDADALPSDQDIAASIGVGRLPVSFRDDDPSSPARDGEIMAEAFLVEDEIEDDEDKHDNMEDVELGGGKGAPTDPGDPSASDPVVVVATAKKVSSLVRFAQDHCLAVGVAALLLVGGIAGISAFVATRNVPEPVASPDAATAVPTPEWSDTPSLAPTVSSVPSGSPTLSPTNAPTLPCNLSPEDRSAAIVEDLAGMGLGLVPSSTSSDRKITRTSNPRLRAAAWVAYDDALYPPLCPGGADSARLEQRFGLALLHYSTSGRYGRRGAEEVAAGGGDSDGPWNGRDGWKLQSSERSAGFLTDINECDWAGVDCDTDTNAVTRIRLAGRNLYGEIFLEQLGMFGQLKELNLANNRIWGSIPDRIANLTELEFVYLQNNKISGTLPSALGRLSNLRELNMAGNNLEGGIPESLLDLDLAVLDLSRNKLGGELDLSGRASELRRHLSVVNESNFNSNTSNSSAPNVEGGGLAELRSLDLSSNSFSGSLPDYFPPDLVHLRLNGNNFNGTLTSQIYDLSKLEELHLHRNALSGELSPDVGDLANLRVLSLSNNNLNGTLPERIGELESLDVVRLGSNPRLGGRIPPSLLKLNITTISIEGTNLVGNVSDAVCAAGDDDGAVVGTGGGIERLIATCNPYQAADTCDPQTSICCSCCDCREPESDYQVPSPNRRFCYHFGLDFPFEDDVWEDYGENILEILLYSENRTERILALLSIALSSLEMPTSDFPISEMPVSEMPVSETEQLSSPDVPNITEHVSAQERARDWLINADQYFLEFGPANASDILLRYSLAVLYFSTGGDDWSYCSAHESSICGTGGQLGVGEERFLSNSSACDWAGVRCDDESNYVSIELDRNGLRGEIPSTELGGLCLDTLSLRGNPGIDIDLESPSSYFLTELRKLDLSENALTGTLDGDRWEVGLLFSSILELHLADNYFSGTLPEGCCGKQVSLDLSNNILTGTLPSWIEGYYFEVDYDYFVEDLRLNDNLLNGTVPGALAQLSVLDTLTLHNNDFSGSVPDSICDLTFHNGGQLENLWADCANGDSAEVVCECCSMCFE